MPAVFCPWEHGMPAPTPWSGTSFECSLCESILAERQPEREKLGAVTQAPQEDVAGAADLDFFAPGPREGKARGQTLP